jgi:GDPmannose 4,6-dehydratase
VTKRALITGVAGQDGTYLTDLLVAEGYQVFGVLGPAPGAFVERIDGWDGAFVGVQADMTDTGSLRDVVAETSPDEVYNFAGISSVGQSWSEAELVANVNGVGVVRLLEAIRDLAPGARFCQASSAEIFGRPSQVPQNEQTPFAPVSPYGDSKAYGHFVTTTYRDAHGIHASNAILYNHESPLRPVSFVTAKIAEGAARIKLGLANELELGNLDVRRDWGFAGDYVRAMWLMLQADTPSDFVISTGVAHSVRDVCECAFARVGLDCDRYVRVNPAFFRPAEAEVLVGDSSKARELLGWEPEVGFDELIGMMVDASLERVGGVAV